MITKTLAYEQLLFTLKII